MLHFTKEQYDYLTTVEDRLYAACYLQFVRLSSRKEAEELSKIYESVFHKKSGILGGCSHCVYTDCKNLGKLYFEDKKEMEEMAKNKATETIEDEKPIEAPKKTKKASTTKKTANKNKKK